MIDINSKDEKQNIKFLGGSIILHLILVFVLLANIVIVSKNKDYKDFFANNKNNTDLTNKINKAKEIEPINAVAIQKDEIQREVARIKQLEISKKQKEEKRIKELNNKVSELNQAKEKYQKIKEAHQKDILNLNNKKHTLEKNLTEIEEKKHKAKEELQVVKEKSEQLKSKLQKEALKQKLLAELKEKQEKRMLDILSEEESELSKEQERLSIKQKQILKYISLQRNKVSQNWLANDRFIGKKLETKLEISLSPSGEILSVDIIKSSGDSALDLSAKNAVLKSSPLPVPNDKNLFSEFKKYRFTFKPDELKIVN